MKHSDFDKQRSNGEPDMQTRARAITDLRKTPDHVVMQCEATAMEFYRRDQLDRALDMLEKLVLIRPDEPTYWTLMGVVFRRKNRRAPALSCLRRAVELDRDDRNSLINLAEVLVEVGKVPEGVDLMRAVFEQGFDPALSPEEHDPITIRAGAQLEFIGGMLDHFIDGARDDLSAR